MPMDSSTTLYGLGLRTWHFIEPLLRDGHQLYLIGIRIPHDASLPDIQKQEFPQWTYLSVNNTDLYLNPAFLQEIHDAFNPDAILGINTYPAYIASLIQSEKPFWADLNGALMTEAQAKSAVIGNDQPVLDFWKQELAVIHRADIFSTVSIPQKYMLLGELASIGRINQYTVDYDFACWIPNSIEDIESPKPSNGPYIRGKLTGENDFVVLWSGGYNTWTDVETLYRGLHQAMEQNPNIHFVSTGGALKDHDESTYLKFQQLIQASPFKNRFHLMGWIPTEDVLGYYYESNLGISIDTLNYETLTGARNRLIHMMKVGLPVLTSLGTEISRIIQKEKIGFTFDIGNADQLTQRILDSAKDLSGLKELGLIGKQYVYQHFTYGITTQPVREWMKHPRRCPHGIAKPAPPAPDAQSSPGEGKPVQDMVNYFKTKFRRNKTT